MSKAKAKKKKTEAQAPPAQIPLPGTVQTYVPVKDEVLAQHMRAISLDQVRVYLKSKVEILQSLQQDCPWALFTDIENVIVYLQVAEIRDVVKCYIKIMETLRFWRSWCQEKERGVERERKLLQRRLMDGIRQGWNTDVDGRISNDAVENKARMDPVHESQLKTQEHWEYLGDQINQLISSVQTELLVQASMWERASDIPNANVPIGAMSGPPMI